MSGFQQADNGNTNIRWTAMKRLIGMATAVHVFGQKWPIFKKWTWQWCWIVNLCKKGKIFLALRKEERGAQVIKWDWTDHCCQCCHHSATKVLQISPLWTWFFVPNFVEIHPKVDKTFESQLTAIPKYDVKLAPAHCMIYLIFSNHIIFLTCL